MVFQERNISEEEKEAIINGYGSGFCDLADEDYIASRMLYKMGFHEQYLLLGQQAIEKYLKSILLYNKISLVDERNRFGHDLKSLSERIKKINHIKESNIDIYKKIYHFFNGAENIKYAIDGSSSDSESLLALDEFVSIYRRYCCCNDIKVIAGKDNNTNEYITESRKREDTIGYKYDDFGLLKEIVQGKKTHKYQALVWKNLFWGKRKKGSITFKKYSRFRNPLFWGNAELNFAAKYIHIPKTLLDSHGKYFDNIYNHKPN